MKNITRFTGLLFVAAIMTFAFSSESQAVPAFARQMGVACSTCHFQHFPELNAFGRSFKASGYSMKGSQALIEDENLSIPANLNATFVIKFRDIKNNGASGQGRDNAMGMIDFPDEAALIVAGRAGEHMGFLAELAGGAVANFKMPVGWEVGDGNLDIIPFTTDSLGAQMPTELMNTGTNASIRAFEDSSRVASAARYLRITDDSKVANATGIALAYATPLYQVSVTEFAPHGPGADQPVTSLATYARAIVTPQVAGWDLGIGVGIWTGTYEGDTKSGTGTTADPYVKLASPAKEDVKATIIDAQAMGQVGGMPLGVFLSYGSVPKTGTGAVPNHLNTTKSDKTATSVSAELGVLPKLTVGLGFRTATLAPETGSSVDDNGIMIAAIYKLAQNVQVGLTQTMLSGTAHNAPDNATPGDGVTSSTMLNVFAAF